MNRRLFLIIAFISLLLAVSLSGATLVNLAKANGYPQSPEPEPIATPAHSPTITIQDPQNTH